MTIGPNGKRIEALPDPDVRWTALRKAELVAAVRGGLIDMGKACEVYSLTTDEFRLWERKFSRHGFEGLKTTKTQQYR